MQETDSDNSYGSFTASWDDDSCPSEPSTGYKTYYQKLRESCNIDTLRAHPSQMRPNFDGGFPAIESSELERAVKISIYERSLQVSQETLQQPVDDRTKLPNAGYQREHPMINQSSVSIFPTMSRPVMQEAGRETRPRQGMAWSPDVSSLAVSVVKPVAYHEGTVNQVETPKGSSSLSLDLFQAPYGVVPSAQHLFPQFVFQFPAQNQDQESKGYEGKDDDEFAFKFPTYIYNQDQESKGYEGKDDDEFAFKFPAYSQDQESKDHETKNDDEFNDDFVEPNTVERYCTRTKSLRVARGVYRDDMESCTNWDATDPRPWSEKKQLNACSKDRLSRRAIVKLSNSRTPMGMFQPSDPLSDLCLDGAVYQAESKNSPGAAYISSVNTGVNHIFPLPEPYNVEGRVAYEYGGEGWWDGKDRKQGRRGCLCVGFSNITLVILIGAALGTVIYGLATQRSGFSLAAATSSSNTMTEYPTRSPLSVDTDAFLPGLFNPTSSLNPTSSSSSDTFSRVSSAPTTAPTSSSPSLIIPPTTAPPASTTLLRTPAPASFRVTKHPTVPTDAPVPETADPSQLPEIGQAVEPIANSPPLPASPSAATQATSTAGPIVGQRLMTLENISIRLKEPPAYTDLNRIGKRISPSITVNEIEYTPYSCSRTNDCDLYVTVHRHDSIYLKDSDEWFYTTSVSVSPVNGNEGLPMGDLKLRIRLENGEDYVWKLDAAAWFRVQQEYETAYQWDVSGNGPLMSWKFDVVRAT
jgi:hypothetical protein